MPIPRFLRSKQYTNGQVREDHSSKSMYFDTCPEEKEPREFQIVSTDPRRGISVFRCVICGFRVRKTAYINSAPAETNNKRS